MPRFLMEIDTELKAGVPGPEPGYREVASVAQDRLIRGTTNDTGLTWEVLSVREVPVAAGPGRDGYRDVVVTVTVHVPLDVRDAAVTAALGAALDEPPCYWGQWHVGDVVPLRAQTTTTTKPVT